MSIAALVTWVITAGFGFFMLIRWATRGGVRKVDGAETHLPPVRVFTHFGLAAAGLIVWIIYLVTGATLLAWIAVADLVLVAILGVVMARQWAKDGEPLWPPPRPAPYGPTRAGSISPSSTSHAPRSCYTGSSPSAHLCWCCSPHSASAQADLAPHTAQ